jgi:hypothetical protein
MFTPSRIVASALAVGVLFAIATGVSVATSEPDANPRVAPSVHTVFSPEFALVGFVLGSPIGAAIGFLWGRSGLVGVLGLLLVTLVGGFVGLMAAAFLGAETRTAVTETSVSMDHGAPAEVLIVGAVLGMIGGASVAWLFRPSKRGRPDGLPS